MDKPEALRLADALTQPTYPDWVMHIPAPWHPPAQETREAAAELRRLSAVEAQRDALLEVLKYLDKEFRQHGRQHWPEAGRVRTAIKAVEEGK